MRGEDSKQEAMFSYLSPEKRVPAEHPLRSVREMVDGVLEQMSPRFAKLYADVGRPSIAPERLLRALLLQIFYSVRSERLLMEQLDYNLLFRWFVGLAMDEPVWNHAVFSKNRERLLNEEIAEAFFQRVLALAQPYLSDEHFTVDGTLLEAWASHKSFRRKDSGGGPDSRNREANVHGERRTNETHQSTTDPEARLYKKSAGSEAKLCYLGHALMENRHGLLVKTRVTQATGTAERDAALEMTKKTRGKKHRTLGGDKGFDTRDLVRQLRRIGVTPHVAQNTERPGGSAIDARTTRHAGYGVSQQKRKRIEQSFGWMKVIGMLQKVKLRGLEKLRWLFTFVGAAYNLCRLGRLEAAAV
ncbi:MAG: IS5 family transposase [Acidobacteria bacterium]|nr:IS5 family transposase [Acidobacteriota bacterium]